MGLLKADFYLIFKHHFGKAQKVLKDALTTNFYLDGILAVLGDRGKA